MPAFPPCTVVLFSRVCNLCNGFVQFVINRDSAERFKFASVQSEVGQQVLKEQGLSAQQFKHVLLLLENGRVYTRSTGGLRMLRRLRGRLPLLYAFVVVLRV